MWVMRAMGVRVGLSSRAATGNYMSLLQAHPQGKSGRKHLLSQVKNSWDEPVVNRESGFSQAARWLRHVEIVKTRINWGITAENSQQNQNKYISAELQQPKLHCCNSSNCLISTCLKCEIANCFQYVHDSLHLAWFLRILHKLRFRLILEL